MPMKDGKTADGNQPGLGIIDLTAEQEEILNNILDKLSREWSDSQDIDKPGSEKSHS